MSCVFFFSSRRRHTRWTGDWSSDVCSSDLRPPATGRSSSAPPMPLVLAGSEELKKTYLSPVAAGTAMFSYCLSEPRSEERRVGEEGRSRGAPDALKKKERAREGCQQWCGAR